MTRRFPTAWFAWVFALLAFFGKTSVQAEQPAVPASSRASDWLKRFDRDADQRLNEGELTAALAELFPEKAQFLRVTRDDKKVAKTLETAIVRFESKDGKQQVDLIGAVHVADTPYYRELNRRFRDYDVVLYELIAPEGTRVPAGGAGRSQHPVGHMQQSMKSMLNLSFQLEQIDYQAKNLVHADLSPEEFAASMEERGESFLQILFRMLGHSASQAGKQKGPGNLDLFQAMFARDRSLQLKRILAEQFEDMEGQMEAFEGPKGSTIISERNKRAMTVLKRELENGRKRVAIFYGAGHLPDMAQRLETDFQLQRGETTWLTAWKMEGK